MSKLHIGLLLTGVALTCHGANWPQYRGAGHDGQSTDRITKQWTGSVTNPVWRVALPNSLSSLTVSGGRVFTKVRRIVDSADKEVCVALDAASGQELWATPVDNASYPGGGVGDDDGPRTTPVVDGDSVYVLSSYLKLYRLNATTGGITWQKDLLSLYSGSVIGWQNAASPMIENGLIYVNGNCGTQRLLALRTSDGGLAWRSQNEGMTHSTPVIATIEGVRQVIFATQGGLVSVDPQTGSRFWKYTYPFGYSTSLAVSPVVYSNMVFVSGAYGMGSVVVRVTFATNTWSTTKLWNSTALQSHWMTPVCHEGSLYGQVGSALNSPLKCIDMATGVTRWSVNNFGRGGIALVDNHLLVVSEPGDLVLVKPVTNAYTELGRFPAILDFHTDTNKCWNSPAIADGHVYVRSTYYGAAFDLSLPNLTLEAPLKLNGGRLQLTVRTADGSPLDSNRVAALEVRATTNLFAPRAAWEKLTNALVLTNGAARLDNVDPSAQPQRFFIVNEPQ